MTSKKRLVESMTPEALKRVVTLLGLPADRRSPFGMRDCLVRAGEVTPELVLECLPVPDLRSVYAALGLETGGRRAEILDRLARYQPVSPGKSRFGPAPGSRTVPREEPPPPPATACRMSHGEIGRPHGVVPGREARNPTTAGFVTVALVDTETTGLYPTSDRIIEIAVMVVQAERSTGKVTKDLEAYQSLHDPGVRIPWEATNIHGITNAMVKGHRIDANRVRSMLSGVDLLVAHNAGFDKGFVAQVIPEVREMPWACSCRGIPWKQHFPGIPNVRLQDLRQHLELAAGTAHRAMGDVETTRRLLEVELPGLGRTALGHLIARKLG